MTWITWHSWSSSLREKHCSGFRDLLGLSSLETWYSPYSQDTSVAQAPPISVSSQLCPRHSPQRVNLQVWVPFSPWEGASGLLLRPCCSLSSGCLWLSSLPWCSCSQSSQHLGLFPDPESGIAAAGQATLTVSLLLSTCLPGFPFLGAYLWPLIISFSWSSLPKQPAISVIH